MSICKYVCKGISLFIVKYMQALRVVSVPYPVTCVSEHLLYEQSEQGEVRGVESDHLQVVDHLKVLVEHGEALKSPLMNFSVLSV